MANYFNTLNLREKLDQLGRCRFMDRSEFADGGNYLKGKKIVSVGCGAQGLNQDLKMRDSCIDSAKNNNKSIKFSKIFYIPCFII